MSDLNLIEQGAIRPHWNPWGELATQYRMSAAMAKALERQALNREREIARAMMAFWDAVEHYAEIKRRALHGSPERRADQT
jgi:hypothetical protein